VGLDTRSFADLPMSQSCVPTPFDEGGADRVGSTIGPGRSMVCPSSPTVPPDPFQDEGWRMKLSPGSVHASGEAPQEW